MGEQLMFMKLTNILVSWVETREVVRGEIGGAWLYSLRWS